MLAYHYSKTENVSKACQYLKLSGDKALGNFSPSEAVQFYREAASLLRDQPESQDNSRVRLEILQAMAYPLRPLGYPEGSVEFLEEGGNLARDLGDRKAQAYFQTNIGVYYLASGGDPVKGREYIERVLGESELTEEVEIIVPTTYELIASYSAEGAFSRSCQVAPKVIALMEQTHTEHKRFDRPANIYSILHGFYGQSLAATGNFTEGERFLDKGLSFARDIDNPMSIAMIEMLYGTFCLFKGDAENQVKHYRSSIDYLEKSQMSFFLGVVWTWLGGAYLYSGQTDTALRYAQKGLEMHTDLGLPLFLGSIHSTLGEVHLGLSNLEKALVHAEQAVDLSQKNNERFFEAEARITLGRVIAATDRMKFDEALEMMLQGIRMLDELQIRPRHAVGLLCIGELYADAGQKEEALENLKKAEGMFRGMGMDYWLGKTQEVLGAV